MLMPKRVKHRKQFRGSMRGKALRGNVVTNGDFGLVAAEPCWITSNQIEAARIAMTRYIKRGGKVWIKIFPDKPVTAKPAETRMGSGKGAVEYWVAVVKPGRVMFEIAGVSEEVAREALRLAMHKLPCKCKIINGDALEQGQLYRIAADRNPLDLLQIDVQLGDDFVHSIHQDVVGEFSSILYAECKVIHDVGTRHRMTARYSCSDYPSVRKIDRMCSRSARPYIQ